MKSRERWYQQTTWSAMRAALLREIGRLKQHESEHWPIALLQASGAWRGYTSHAGRILTKQVARILADNETERYAFDTMVRLNGRKGLKAWAVELVRIAAGEPEVRPLTAEEKLLARLHGVRRARDKREANARSKLASWQRELKIAQERVAHWRAIVRRYDRKKTEAA